ncbi:MAG: hypothetical protein AAF141_16440 [Pseudomonadota bacterium]
MGAKLSTCAGFIIACALAGELESAVAAPASADQWNDRTVYISTSEFSGTWPFKADEGFFFFCYRVGPFTYLTFYEYPDGPNQIKEPGFGFSLDADPLSVILEATLQGQFLRPFQDPQTLMGAVIQLRKLAREKCGEPYLNGLGEGQAALKP